MSAGQLWRGVLTPTEAEVVELVAEGLDNKAIAKDLFVSEQTVKFHVHNVFKRLGFSNRTQLAVWWVRNVDVDVKVPARWEGSE